LRVLGKGRIRQFKDSPQRQKKEVAVSTGYLGKKKTKASWPILNLANPVKLIID
jgi:hypothetical protein